MQPLPDKNTILTAVAGSLAASAQRSEQPGLSFKLRLAAGLVAMTERELRLETGHRQAEKSRLAAYLETEGELESLNALLVERIKNHEIDWPATVALVKENLKAELAVIQPKFDTEL